MSKLFEKCLIVDIETTNLYKNPVEVVQIAVSKLNQELNPKDAFSCFVKPKNIENFDGYCQHLTGFTQELILETGNDWIKVCKICSQLSRIPILGWNIGFDAFIMREQCKRYQIAYPFGNSIDLMSWAYLYSEKYNKKVNYSLQSFAEHLGIQPEPAHNAMNDVLTTINVLKELNSLLIQN